MGVKIDRKAGSTQVTPGHPNEGSRTTALVRVRDGFNADRMSKTKGVLLTHNLARDAAQDLGDAARNPDLAHSTKALQSVARAATQGLQTAGEFSVAKKKLGNAPGAAGTLVNVVRVPGLLRTGAREVREAVRQGSYSEGVKGVGNLSVAAATGLEATRQVHTFGNAFRAAYGTIRANGQRFLGALAQAGKAAVSATYSSAQGVASTSAGRAAVAAVSRLSASPVGKLVSRGLPILNLGGGTMWAVKDSIEAAKTWDKDASVGKWATAQVTALGSVVSAAGATAVVISPFAGPLAPVLAMAGGTASMAGAVVSMASSAVGSHYFPT